MNRIVSTLIACILVLTACGSSSDGAVDLSQDDVPPAGDATLPPETPDDDSDPVADATDFPADTEPSVDDGLEIPGPPLEPINSFALPDSAGSITRGGNVALSPTGDRVAVLTFDDALTGTLTVYESATGAQLVSETDERFAGTIFWTADDRLLTGAVQGEVWAWDAATLASMSQEPLSSGDNLCGNSSGIAFDPGADALYLVSSIVCRIDTNTGEVIVHDSDPDLLGDLRVAIGGSEVYLKWVSGDNVLMTRVLDAATLETIRDEPADPDIAAASGNGRIEKLGGNDKVVQPAGQMVSVFGPVVQTSAGGAYYFGDAFDVLTVIASVDGSTIGTVDTSAQIVHEVDWSADDTVMATRTDSGITIYAVG